MIRIYIMVARQGKSRVSGDLYFMESKVLIFFFYPLNIYPPQKANRKTVNSDLDWYNAMTEYNEGDVEKALVEWVRSILILFFLVYFQPWWKGVIFFVLLCFTDTGGGVLFGLIATPSTIQFARCCEVYLRNQRTTKTSGSVRGNWWSLFHLWGIKYIWNRPL